MNGVHFLDARGPEGMRIYAIGDVHGRLDLLREMHAGIGAEIARDAVADWRIIHLGDYVDRGPDSKGVLDFVVDLQARESRVIALAGNHDIGFAEFLDLPDPNGLFANWGGDATARSYGVDADFRDVLRLTQAHAALARAVPRRHKAFLAGLGLSLSFGDFFFCHAGVRPGVDLDAQSPEDLTWIREPFLQYDRLHAKVIVHGHTPQREPEILPNRVNVDTLAYYSGVLTALVIDGADKRILSVREVSAAEA